jgi:hypothetical protein
MYALNLAAFGHIGQEILNEIVLRKWCSIAGLAWPIA